MIMINIILAILLTIIVYVSIGAIIGINIDYEDGEIIVAFAMFWAILLPIMGIIYFIKTLIKIFKEELY